MVYPKEIQWKVKVVLHEGSLMNFILGLSEKIKGGNGVSQSIIDELHSSDIQGDHMEDESGVTRSIID